MAASAQNHAITSADGQHAGSYSMMLSSVMNGLSLVMSCLLVIILIIHLLCSNPFKALHILHENFRSIDLYYALYYR